MNLIKAIYFFTPAFTPRTDIEALVMLRYPGNKIENKGKKWTVKQLDAIPASWAGDTICDGEGLNGDVRVLSTGEVKVAFKYTFKFEGKFARYYCGTYPDMSLDEIRDNRDEAKKSLKRKINPREAKVAEVVAGQEEVKATLEREAQRKAESLTVSDLFKEWIVNGVHRKDDNKLIKSMFENHILPALGKIELRGLTEKDLMNTYKAIAKTKQATAFEVSKDFKQMMAWAEKRQPWRKLLSESNPAELVKRDSFLPKGFDKERDRVLAYDEIRALKAAFDKLEHAYQQAQNKNKVCKPIKKEVQLAMWICLSTLCRIGELMKAEWSHVDFEARVWHIPASNTKGVEGKKTEHKVYLSDFTLRQFKQLQSITDKEKWLFPAMSKKDHVCERSYTKQIGDRQVQFKQRSKKLQNRVEDNSLVIGDREWTPHDLRRTGATMIQSFYNAAEGHLLAELCLHHSILAGAAKHYLLHDHKEAMTNAWQLLGERIETILNSNNVVNFEKMSA